MSTKVGAGVHGGGALRSRVIMQWKELSIPLGDNTGLRLIYIFLLVEV